MKNFFIASALLLLFSAPLSAAKRPLNPRRKRPLAPATDKKTPVRSLAGEWSAESVDAIEALIQARGAQSADYSEDAPPVAVVPFTNGMIDGDFAELVFWRLLTQAEFKVDEDFWHIVPIAYGRQRARAAYEAFHDKPQSSWPEQPEFMAFRKTMLKSYRDVCARVGRKECRVYIARLFRGQTEEEARAFAELVWDDEVAREESLDPVPGFPGDPEPLTVQRGIRPTLEMVELVRRLRQSGFDVWMPALVAHPVLEAAAPKLGLDVSRVRGIKQSLFKERMTGRVLEPIPARAGRIAAVIKNTGRAPDFVVGSTGDDEALLAYGKGLRILLDGGDEKLRAQAREKGWLVQAAFKRR